MRNGSRISLGAASSKQERERLGLLSNQKPALLTYGAQENDIPGDDHQPNGVDDNEEVQVKHVLFGALVKQNDYADQMK